MAWSDLCLYARNGCEIRRIVFDDYFWHKHAFPLLRVFWLFDFYKPYVLEKKIEEGKTSETTTAEKILISNEDVTNDDATNEDATNEDATNDDATNDDATNDDVNVSECNEDPSAIRRAQLAELACVLREELRRSEQDGGMFDDAGGGNGNGNSGKISVSGVKKNAQKKKKKRKR